MKATTLLEDGPTFRADSVLQAWLEKQTFKEDVYVFYRDKKDILTDEPQDKEEKAYLDDKRILTIRWCPPGALAKDAVWAVYVEYPKEQAEVAAADYLKSNYPTLAVTLLNDGWGFHLIRSEGTTDEFCLEVVDDQFYRAPLSKKDILALAKELTQLVEDERALNDLKEW